MPSQPISEEMLKALRSHGLPEVKENNQYLVVHLKGDGNIAPDTWNAKVYRKATGAMTVVTTDLELLSSLISNTPQPIVAKPGERVIMIDDSGWGFPVGGTLIGLHDSLDNSIHIGEVPVTFYQEPCFSKKAYLWKAASVVVRLLGELEHPNADIFDCRTVNPLFTVCTGYVNTGIVKELRERGFRVVTCKIGEPLQSELEKRHTEYIAKLVNADIYYDPKGMKPQAIGRAYNRAIDWIIDGDHWKLAKTGWRSMSKFGWVSKE